MRAREDFRSTTQNLTVHQREQGRHPEERGSAPQTIHNEALRAELEWQSQDWKDPIGRDLPLHYLPSQNIVQKCEPHERNPCAPSLRPESKRGGTEWRAKWENALSGKQFDNVRQETHAVSVTGPIVDTTFAPNPIEAANYHATYLQSWPKRGELNVRTMFTRLTSLSRTSTLVGPPFL